MGCASASSGSVPPSTSQVGQAGVRPGIDVLLTDSAELVHHRAVGLVTNQTGVDAHGISDVTRLREAGVGLVALFSPEHGFRGAADPALRLRHRKIRPLGYQSTAFTAGLLPPLLKCFRAST